MKRVLGGMPAPSEEQAPVGRKNAGRALTPSSERIVGRVVGQGGMVEPQKPKDRAPVKKNHTKKEPGIGQRSVCRTSSYWFGDKLPQRGKKKKGKKQGKGARTMPKCHELTQLKKGGGYPRPTRTYSRLRPGRGAVSTSLQGTGEGPRPCVSQKGSLVNRRVRGTIEGTQNRGWTDGQAGRRCIHAKSLPSPGASPRHGGHHRESRKHEKKHHEGLAVFPTRCEQTEKTLTIKTEEPAVAKRGSFPACTQIQEKG